MTAAIARLHAEQRPSAFGIATPIPRLSWSVDSTDTDAVQVAYELESDGVSTGRVVSADQVLLSWPFAPLASRARAEVRVRSWLSTGTQTPWSDPLPVEVALLDDADWEVDFISPSTHAPAEGVRPGHLMRAEFTVPQDVVRARIYATAHGLYTLTLNGERVGDEELAPGWTSYNHRLRYQAYDVTAQLASGANAIGAELTDGWYRGRIGFHGGIWDNYGHDVALLLQLELTRASGEIEVVPLDDRWTTASGPVVTASLYDGEHFDARLVPDGWNAPGFDDSTWAAPSIISRADFPAKLEAPIGVPVRVIERLAPVSVEYRPGGRVRLDFGQNIAGRLEITVAGSSGDRISLHHAEVLEDDELATRPLRGAPSVDTYVLAGQGSETWSPRFTIHGFRYAELDGWPGEFDSSMVAALVIHSDMERTGWFESSNELVNKLHENTVWSMRDNFVDLPTDCPQRDERLGWTGDIQVFAPAASFLYSSGGTLTSWLRDVSAEQSPTGAVPNFVPWIECGFPRESSAAWGDAAVIVPWVMYQRNGDRGILAEQFESMTGWVDHLAGMADSSGLIREGMQLGDWLDPAAPPEDPGAGVTDKYLVATAYLAHSARLVARAATVLGKSQEASRYTALSDSTGRAFRAEYVTATGRMVNETPTALSLALVFDLVTDPAQRARAGARLAELVKAGNYRVQTGFVGTPIICDALALAGETDVAYRLLIEQECPSWLYPVTMGATTIWERWDSMLPDGSVNPGEMTSFNHYALGAVIDFLHRVVAGLAPADIGYRRMSIAPRPGPGFESAIATLVTPYGLASSAWTLEAGEFRLDVVVPVGSVAEVALPDGSESFTVGSGAHHFETRVQAAVASAA